MNIQCSSVKCSKSEKLLTLIEVKGQSIKNNYSYSLLLNTQYEKGNSDNKLWIVSISHQCKFLSVY